jgi:hypothetical protein
MLIITTMPPRKRPITTRQQREQHNAMIRAMFGPRVVRRYNPNNAATVIQARVRGILTRKRMANPRNEVGQKAVMAMLTRLPNAGAGIRAGIRYGPERRITPRHPRGLLVPATCNNFLHPCGLSGRRSPRRSPNRSPRRSPNRSPRSNNFNLYQG